MKRFQLKTILAVTGVVAIALRLDLLLLAQLILKVAVMNILCQRLINQRLIPMLTCLSLEVFHYESI